jgi:hypothetical protein
MGCHLKERKGRCVMSVYYGDVDHPISGQIDPGVS